MNPLYDGYTHKMFETFPNVVEGIKRKSRGAKLSVFENIVLSKNPWSYSRIADGTNQSVGMVKEIERSVLLEVRKFSEKVYTVINFVISGCYEQAKKDGKDAYLLCEFLDRLESILRDIDSSGKIDIVFQDFSYMVWHRDSGGNPRNIKVTQDSLKKAIEKFPWIGDVV